MNHTSALTSRPTLLQRIYPWVAITICACFLFYKYIMQVSPSIMTHELMRTFNVHGAGLGNLAATFFYSYLITQIFVGVLLDKYSTRFLSAGAIFISAIGAYLFSESNTLWMAECTRALMGIGAAFATVSYMKIAAMWFRKDQFAFISGLLATAAMLGAVFGEAPLSMIVQSAGWRQSLWVVSLFGFAVAILFLLLIRDRKTSSVLGEQAVTFSAIKRLIQNPQNWLLTFYSGLAFSPVAVFGGLWGNPYLEQAHHYSPTHAATLISLIFIGLAIGGPVLGYLSDRLNNRRTFMLLGTFISLVSIIMTIYFTHLPEWILIIFLLLFGFGTGAFMLGFAIGKEINPVGLAATVIALINTGDAIFGAISEPLLGKILDFNWTGKMVHQIRHFSLENYHHAFLLLPAYLLVALFLVFFIREPKTHHHADIHEA